MLSSDRSADDAIVISDYNFLRSDVVMSTLCELDGATAPSLLAADADWHDVPNIADISIVIPTSQTGNILVIFTAQLDGKCSDAGDANYIQIRLSVTGDVANVWKWDGSLDSMQVLHCHNFFATKTAGTYAVKAEYQRTGNRDDTSNFTTRGITAIVLPYLA